jgi:hypothetical protein
MRTDIRTNMKLNDANINMLPQQSHNIAIRDNYDSPAHTSVMRSSTDDNTTMSVIKFNIAAKSSGTSAPLTEQYTPGANLICFQQQNAIDHNSPRFVPPMFYMFDLSQVTNLPAQHLHEVIIGRYPHKMYLDIDISADKGAVLCSKQDINAFIAAIKVAALELWNAEIASYIVDIQTADDIIVYSSHGPHKYSFHLILFPKYAFKDHNACFRFYRDLCDKLLTHQQKYVRDFAAYIDRQVYSSQHNMRMCGVTKGDRIKILDTECNSPQIISTHTWCDSLITDIRKCATSLVRYAPTSAQNSSAPISSANITSNATHYSTSDITSAEFDYNNIIITELGHRNMVIGYDDDVSPHVSAAAKKYVSAADAHECIWTSQALNAAKNNGLLVGLCYRHTTCSQNGFWNLLFDRVAPSFCKLCERQHNNDNTLIVIIAPPNAETNARYLYAICRHDSTKSKYPLGFAYDTNSTASHNIYYAADEPKIAIATEVVDVVAYVPTPAPKLLYRLPIIDRITAAKTKFDTHLQNDIYNDIKMHAYPCARTVCIDAPMKLGKTKQLIEHIQLYYPQIASDLPIMSESQVRPSKIRIITFRQTFAFEMYKKCSFLGFILYSDVDGALTQDRVIVQMESMHRLTTDPIDLLILDECESIFEQLNSGLFKNFRDAYAKFHFMLRTARKVICMDAYMSDRTYNILDAIRTLIDTTYVRNTFSRDTDIKVVFTKHQGEWIFDILSAIKSGRKIAIMTNSKEDANALEHLLTGDGDGLETLFSSKYFEQVKDWPILADRQPLTPPFKICVGKYTAEEPQIQIKHEHFQDIDSAWSKYDVLITTPTVSAGVSFEVEHFDRVYGLFTDLSCGAETSMQMLGRIRAVREKNLFICIRETYGGYAQFPTNVSQIKTAALNRYDIMLAKPDLSNLSYIYNTNGTIQVYDSDYFTIWAENQRIMHINHNGYLVNFIRLCKKSQFICEYSELMHHAIAKMNATGEDNPSPDEKEIARNEKFANLKMQLDEIKAYLRDIYFDEVATSIDLVPDAYDEIIVRMDIERNYSAARPISFKPVEKEERRAVDKYRLAIYYEVPHQMRQAITFLDVKRYFPQTMRYSFGMLNQLAPVYGRHITMDIWIADAKELQRLTYASGIAFANVYASGDLNSAAINKSITDRVSIIQSGATDIHINIYYLLKLCGWRDVFDTSAQIPVVQIYQVYTTNGSQQQIQNIYDALSILLNKRRLTNRVKCAAIDSVYDKSVNFAIRDIRKLVRDTYNMELKIATNNATARDRKYSLAMSGNFIYRGAKFITYMSLKDAEIYAPPELMDISGDSSLEIIQIDDEDE